MTERYFICRNPRARCEEGGRLRGRRCETRLAWDAEKRINARHVFLPRRHFSRFTVIKRTRPRGRKNDAFDRSAFSSRQCIKRQCRRAFRPTNARILSRILSEGHSTFGQLEASQGVERSEQALGPAGTHGCAEFRRVAGAAANSHSRNAIINKTARPRGPGHDKAPPRAARPMRCR